MALYGLAVGLRQGYAKRLMVPFAGMAVVGLGSTAFHGTLQAWGQAADELSSKLQRAPGARILACLPPIPSLVGLPPPPRSDVVVSGAFTRLQPLTRLTPSPPAHASAAALLYAVLEPDVALRRPWLAPGLLLYCAGFTAAYFVLPFLFFLLSYIAIVVALFLATTASFAAIRLPAARRLLVAAFALYAGGFLLFWLPDKLLCAAVQPLYGHALFHTTSAVGPYSLIQHVAWAFYDRAAHGRSSRSKKSLGKPVISGGLLPIVELV